MQTLLSFSASASSARLLKTETSSKTEHWSNVTVHRRTFSPKARLQTCETFEVGSVKVIGSGADHCPVPPAGGSVADKPTHVPQTSA